MALPIWVDCLGIPLRELCCKIMAVILSSLLEMNLQYPPEESQASALEEAEDTQAINEERKEEQY